MAYYFPDDGSSAHLQKGIATLTPPITISAWFKPDDLTNNNAIATVYNVASGVVCYSLAARGDRPSDPLRATSSLGLGSQYFSRYESFTAGVWQLGTAIFSSNVYRAVYRNGVIGETNSTLHGPPAPLDGLRVGLHALAGLQYMKGHIAEVAIWTGVVTDTAILAMYTAQKSPACYPTNLYAYHKLDGSLVDEQGGGDLSLIGNVVPSAHPPMTYECGSPFGPAVQVI